MKKHLAIILIFCLIQISCEDEPAYKKEGWTEQQFKPEIIEMSKASMDKNPIILSIDKLQSIFGEPKEIKKDCSTIPIRFNQGEKTYDCWIYDSDWNTVFRIDNNQAFLGFFNFEATSKKIETPQITLSKNTKFKEIKKAFPNSYAHRNIGANHLKLEGYEWVYLNDDFPKDKKANPNQIELIFKDGYLKRMEYSWHPNYNDEQWKNYKEKLEEIIDSEK